MAVCAVDNGSGLVLLPMATPAATCAGVTLLEPVDTPPNVLALSMEQGLVVSAAIASVWILAFTWRAIRSALGDHNE